MRKNLFKKVATTVMTLTMVVGLVGAVPAAVKKGTDISNGVKWQGFSIHTREDKGEWEDALKKDGQKYMNTADTKKSYGENAKITSQTSSSFLMDITSTGWSANWAPTGKKDAKGNMVWGCVGNNPWGVTAKKILKIEKGRTYTATFKIKSTLQNEIMESKERADGTGYNVGTGKYNYIKHVHVKAYRNNTKDGDPGIKGTKVTATYKGQNVVTTTKADATKTKYSVIALDSRNDDYVDVTVKFTVDGDNIAYKQNTCGIMIAMGAFLYSFPDENDMKGTVEVKDFKVVAGDKVATSKLKKAKAGKNKISVSTKKVKGAKSYEFQYAPKKTFVGKKTVKSKKPSTVLKGKKIKSKKTVYVRVRVKTKKGYTVWSAPKKVKVK
ncbi:MAG: hypothetical protein HFG30_00120 [Eubacterium sp.]|jgi:hypothetical protein|nr:hypothetical protein [Eubacterium sp.]